MTAHRPAHKWLQKVPLGSAHLQHKGRPSSKGWHQLTTAYTATTLSRVTTVTRYATPSCANYVAIADCNHITDTLQLGVGLLCIRERVQTLPGIADSAIIQ